MSQPPHYLIVPGWQGSPPRHWQSHWHRRLPNSSRVEQDDWQLPRRSEWVARLQDAIEHIPGPVILIGHSLGCVTVAHWAAHAPQHLLRRVSGALLVAPADVERNGCPEPLLDFAPLPRLPLPFASLLVASDNDPAASAPSRPGHGSGLGCGIHPAQWCGAHQRQIGTPPLGTRLCLAVSVAAADRAGKPPLRLT